MEKTPNIIFQSTSLRPFSIYTLVDISKMCIYIWNEFDLTDVVSTEIFCIQISVSIKTLFVMEKCL